MPSFANPFAGNNGRKMANAPPSARLPRVAPPDKPSVATPRKSGLRTPVLPDRARMFHVKHSFAHSSPPKERRGSPRSRKADSLADLRKRIDNGIVGPVRTPPRIVGSRRPNKLSAANPKAGHSAHPLSCLLFHPFALGMAY